MSITLDLFDATPAKEGEPQGPKGPTHSATTTVDYVYQAEMIIEDVQNDYPTIVRVHSPELGREWRRGEDGKMHEVIALKGYGSHEGRPS
jgi:hypothetical protein